MRTPPKFIILLLLFTPATPQDITATCAPHQKASCVDKTPMETFSYMSTKLKTCLNDRRELSHDLSLASVACQVDAQASKSIDCFSHCVWTNLEGMSALEVNGVWFAKEDSNIVYSIISGEYGERAADKAVGMFARCKPLLQDDPFFPPMERCEELNGFYRCVTFNLLKDLGCEVSAEDRKVIGLLDLSKLGLTERRKRRK